MCKFLFNIIFNNFFTHILLIIICIFNEWVFILHCFLYAEWLKIHVLNSVGLSMRFVNMKNVFSIYIVKSLCWLHLNAIFSTIHFIFFSRMRASLLQIEHICQKIGVDVYWCCTCHWCVSWRDNRFWFLRLQIWPC